MKRPLFARAVFALVAFALACVLTACGSDTPDSAEAADAVRDEALAVELARETVRGGYALITANEMGLALATGGAMMIVDARPRDAYDQGHLPGAVCFPFPADEMEEWDNLIMEDSPEDYAALLGADTSMLVVVYGADLADGASHNGAAWAGRLGHGNVRRFPGGIAAWIGAGQGLESGE